MNKFINFREARENNVKEILFRTPNPKVTIYAGLSGSGKSSIDFGTITTEA
ncbi:MAG TPA: multidrug ABC transporter ATP-binding protein [Chloroflexota bacterium]|nr:multidrug ABC transporter ATP-binding protein [Chloroflexota bacterium]